MDIKIPFGPLESKKNIKNSKLKDVFIIVETQKLRTAESGIEGVS